MTTQYKPIENHYVQLDIAFATAYGVNEAIVFDKLFRLQNVWAGKVDDNGDKWVRLTLEEWGEELPFFSRNTIWRAIDSCIDKKLIKSTVFKGRSKWYRCNPDFISRAKPTPQNGQTTPDDKDVSPQNGQTQLPKMGKSSPQNGQLPNSLPSSKDNNTINAHACDKPPNEQLADHYRETTGKAPRGITDVQIWDDDCLKILEVAGGDLDRAKGLMDEALKILESGGYAHKSPGSLINTIKSQIEQAKRKRNGGGTNGKFRQSRGAGNPVIDKQLKDKQAAIKAAIARKNGRGLSSDEGVSQNQTSGGERRAAA